MARTLVILVIMVLARTFSTETEKVGFEVQGFNEEILEVSFKTSTSVTISSRDSSSIGSEESSDFSTYLNQLLERVVDNIGKVRDVGRPPSSEAAKTTVDSPNPSMKVMRQKRQHVLTEKKVCPPITFLGYTWIDKKVGTFFSRYNEKSDIINLLSWLLINTILKDKDCPIIVCTVQLDATLPPEFHTRLPFDDFTMDVLYALNVALFELHPNKWAAIQAFQALCYLGPVPPLFLSSVSQEGTMGIITQAGANMIAFCLARKNSIPLIIDNAIPVAPGPSSGCPPQLLRSPREKTSIRTRSGFVSIR
ncbi:hypothetical protein HKD37_19G053864 [Glycine soja]